MTRSFNPSAKFGFIAEKLGDENQVFLFYQSLVELRQSRIAKARLMNQSSVNLKDFDFSDGEEIYQQIVAAINDKLFEIKTAYPHLAKSQLFAKIEDPNWREKFGENFHKLAIDRSKFPEDGDKWAFNKIGDAGFQICYLEGFALGFLAALELAQFYFCQAAVDKLPRIEVGHLPRIFKDFGLLVSCCDGVSANNARSNGFKAPLANCESGTGALEKLWQAKEFSQQNSSPISMFLRVDGEGNDFLRSVFSEYFDHEAAMRGFYQKFQENLFGFKEDLQRATIELVFEMGSFVHLLNDCNGRSATLSGWLISITGGYDLPVPFVQWDLDFARHIEGQKWIAQFLENPQIAPIIGDELKVVEDIKFYRRRELSEQLPAIAFLQEVLQKSLQKCPMIDANLFGGKFEICYLDESDKSFGPRVIAVNRKYGLKDCNILSLKSLFAVCEANQEAILKLEGQELFNFIAEKTMQLASERQAITREEFCFLRMINESVPINLLSEESSYQNAWQRCQENAKETLSASIFIPEGAKPLQASAAANKDKDCCVIS